MIASYPKPPKTKHSRHKSNPKPTYEDYCEFDLDGNLCGEGYASLHEVYAGKNRNNSIHWNMQIRLCPVCHFEVQHGLRSGEYNDVLKQEYQRIFESEYGSRDDFRRIFGKSYL